MGFFNGSIGFLQLFSKRHCLSPLFFDGDIAFDISIF